MSERTNVGSDGLSDQDRDGMAADLGAWVRSQSARELCAICGGSKHLAAHRPALTGPGAGKPLDHAFAPMGHLSLCSSQDDTMAGYPHCDCGAQEQA